MKKKESIHDVAQKLNISAATVSYVLNGKGDEKRISKDLQKTIKSYIKKSGYQPSMIARSLRTGKSQIIGMLVESISDPFFSSIARIIEDKASKLGYKILYSSTDNNTQKTKDLIRLFRERQVDGYIIAPTPGIEKEIKELMSINMPLVLFDRFFSTLSTINVVVDNAGGCYNAILHFIQCGYKKIAMVTLDSMQVQMADRLAGYTKAIEENNRRPIVQKLPYTLTHEQRVDGIRAFLKANKEIDAILFATNYLAISGLQAINQLDLDIPAEVGVISFDDNTHFDLFRPSITAVAQPVVEISETIMQMLWKQLIEDVKKKKIKETIVLPTQLMVRNSVMNLKNSRPALAV